MHIDCSPTIEFHKGALALLAMIGIRDDLQATGLDKQTDTDLHDSSSVFVSNTRSAIANGLTGEYSDKANAAAIEISHMAELLVTAGTMTPEIADSLNTSFETLMGIELLKYRVDNRQTTFLS